LKFHENIIQPAFVCGLRRSGDDNDVDRHEQLDGDKQLVCRDAGRGG
jgi:hypothetical protein